MAMACKSRISEFQVHNPKGIQNRGFEPQIDTSGEESGVGRGGGRYIVGEAGFGEVVAPCGHKMFFGSVGGDIGGRRQGLGTFVLDRRREDS